MTDEENYEAFTYVFNSGVMVEIFLESIPQIIIINVNAWQFGEGGGFAFWFSLCFSSLSVLNSIFPLLAHWYYEGNLERALEMPMHRVKP